LFEAHEASHTQLSIFPTGGLVHKVIHFLEGVYAKELISQVGLHELDDNNKKFGVSHVTQFEASGPEQVKQVASHCLHLRSESSGYWLESQVSAQVDDLRYFGELQLRHTVAPSGVEQVLQGLVQLAQTFEGVVFPYEPAPQSVMHWLLRKYLDPEQVKQLFIKGPEHVAQSE
jgi:hypothetical protein